MILSLGAIRSCLEGAVPATIATCSADGVPNVAYLSQVHYVDEEHVALSYQFFNTTRKNILTNPHAVVVVLDPDSTASYRLKLEYLRTETEGPLFENMKAKLAGIASHSGMSKVFRLQGSDIYRVHALEHVYGDPSPTGSAQPYLLPGVRACLAGIGRSPDLARLFDDALLGMKRHCRIPHAMLLMHDEPNRRLYTVASRGYVESGVGSEIRIGEGIIGVAARERTPIRISYAAHEYLYSRATREGFAQSADGAALETEIPFPGLPDSGSQLAVPLLLAGRLIGVLYVESPEERRFTCEDEDALVVIAAQLAFAIEVLTQAADEHAEPAASVPATVAHGAPLTIRHFTADHSIFIGDEYLIKGVAGAIAWKLLHDFVQQGRVAFTNRELRLDPALKLPDICDNLEARLILLQRRLAERCPFLTIEKTGRGRFTLKVNRPLLLEEVPNR